MTTVRGTAAALCAVTWLLCLAGVASDAAVAEPKIKPHKNKKIVDNWDLATDVVSCDLEDDKAGSGCSYSCICGKILWVRGVGREDAWGGHARDEGRGWVGGQGPGEN